MKQENRCLGCHADVGPSPGWHDCATTAEKQVERLEARLAAVVAAIHRIPFTTSSQEIAINEALLAAEGK